MDGCGGYGKARSPFLDEGGDVGEAVIAGCLEVMGDVGGGVGGEGLTAGGPDGGDPGQAGAGAPLGGEVNPETRADGGFDGGLMFSGKEGWVTDEEGGIGPVEHGEGVGWRGEDGGVCAKEMPKEDLGIGDGGAGGGVCGECADAGEGGSAVLPDEEEDGADVMEGGDGAVGEDDEGVSEGSDGDEAEVGLPGEELGGAEGGCGGVDAVAVMEGFGQGWVGEVPHEGCRVEEVDGGNAEGVHWWIGFARCG